MRAETGAENVPNWATLSFLKQWTLSELTTWDENEPYSKKILNFNQT